MASRRDTKPSPGAENVKPSRVNGSGDTPSPDTPDHLNFAEEDELEFGFDTQPEYSSSPSRKPTTPAAPDEPGEPDDSEAREQPEPEQSDASNEIESSNGNGNGNGATGPEPASASFGPTALRRSEPGAPIIDIPPPPGVDEVPVSGKPSAPWATPSAPDKRRRRLDRERAPLHKRAAGKLRVPGRSNGNGNGNGAVNGDGDGATVTTAPAGGNGNGRGGTIAPPPAPAKPPKPPRPKVKKIRVLFVLAGLSVLAMVSTVFGMMMAVSQDLPALEEFAQYSASQNSVLVDATGEEIGTVTSDENRILLESGQISSTVKNAVVAIEDARFYEHGGVDFQGIGRALGQDILSLSAKQGASTITQQFVKNALETQNSRTVFEKLREAALAYNLEREWDKDKILTAYLNTIYFGEGAYGIEAAARTYFGWNHPGCGTDESPCASVLLPAEAAMLAGVIASPYAYDPKINPNDSKGRRNIVLANMFEQGYISQSDYDEAVVTAVPAASNIEPPSIDSEAPYFATWVRQQLVDKYGPGRAYYGGLKVKTTLDLSLQQAAEDSVRSYLGGIPPTASVVVLDNETGGVKAMVGGPNFDEAPFNIATNGYRQPGSSIKPFTLITALQQGISPYTVYESAPQEFAFGKQGKETFTVTNDGDSYAGASDLVSATINSDNSVYAQLALEGLNGNSVEDRTKSIARNIHRAGYGDRISTNPAMVLGGLDQGVTPLQWTYAYMTISNDGARVSGTLAPIPQEEGGSPVAFTRVTDADDKLIKKGDNDSTSEQVLDEEATQTAKSILAGVVTTGTGTNANIGAEGQWGKTGTTENNGDAWFCGGTEEVTACVWVGYANSNTPMTTLYAGQPVQGGTYPALIWASVISAWEEISAENAAERAARQAANEDEDSSGEESADDGFEPAPETETYTAPTPTETAPAPVTPDPVETAPAPTVTAPTPEPAPVTPAPAPVTPAPTVTPAPSGGGGISGGTGPAG